MDIITKYSTGQRVIFNSPTHGKIGAEVVGVCIRQNDPIIYEVREDGNGTSKPAFEGDLTPEDVDKIRTLDAETIAKIAAFNQLVIDEHNKIFAASEAIRPLIEPIIYNGTTPEVEELLDILTEGSYYQFEVRRQLRYRKSLKP